MFEKRGDTSNIPSNPVKAKATIEGRIRSLDLMRPDIGVLLTPLSIGVMPAGARAHNSISPSASIISGMLRTPGRKEATL